MTQEFTFEIGDYTYTASQDHMELIRSRRVASQDGSVPHSTEYEVVFSWLIGDPFSNRPVTLLGLLSGHQVPLIGAGLLALGVAIGFQLS